jgi:hypothetical protein
MRIAAMPWAITAKKKTAHVKSAKANMNLELETSAPHSTFPPALDRRAPIQAKMPLKIITKRAMLVTG